MFLQQPTAEVSGVSLLSVVRPELRMPLQNALRQARETGQPAEGPSRYLDIRDEHPSVTCRVYPGPDNGPDTCRLVTFETNGQSNQLPAPEREEHFLSVFHSLNEGFCLIRMLFDENHRACDCIYLDYNEAFVRQTGMDNILGKRMLDMVPDHEKFWFEQFGEVALTGKPIRILDQAKYFDNRWFNVYAFPIGRPEDHKVALLFEDVSEYQEAERNRMASMRGQVFRAELSDALRVQSEPLKIQELASRLLGKQLQVMRAAYGEVEPNNEYINVVTDYTEEGAISIVGRYRLNDFGPHIIQQFMAGQSVVVNNVDTDPRLQESEKEATRALGVRAYIAFPLIKGGRTVATMSVHHSSPYEWSREELSLIEETAERTWVAIGRAEAERALRQSEERYRTLFESIDEGFCVLEVLFDEDERPRDYRFLEVNPAFERHTGLQNAVGKTALEMVPDLEGHWVETYGRVALTGVSERFLEESPAMSRWFEVEAFRVGDPQTRRVGLLFTDITERKQTQQALELARDQAENAARAKEDFLAHMSHEIRNPLNAIIGFSKLLMEMEPRPDQEEIFQTMQFAADNLRSLIDDILDFSKLQAGQMVRFEESTDLAKLLDHLHKTHQLRASERGNRLSFHIDPALPRFIGTDAQKLSQVLQNLISNALKFTENGRVTVEARLATQKEEDIWIDFRVSDTGIGIPLDKQADIFDVFSQIDSNTIRPSEGTGLGLAITRSLLELMGSEIQVESEPGAGACFFFTLPARIAPVTDMPEPGNTDTIEEEVDLSHLRLLLVEDVKMNRNVMRRYLHDRWGAQMDEACNGEQGVELAARNRYDLILMDIRMPVLDGYSATRVIRDLPGGREVPIFALTADTEAQVRSHEEAAFFAEIVTKPFEPADLLSRIRSHTPSRPSASS